MKIALLLLLLIPSLAFGQASEPAFQKLKVKLVDYTPEKLCSLCGYRSEASTLKFAVIEGSQEIKRGQSILVIIGCAGDEAYMHSQKTGVDLFKNNQEYLPTIYEPANEPVDARNVRGWYMPYRYEKENLTRYSCRTLVRLP